MKNVKRFLSSSLILTLFRGKQVPLLLPVMNWKISFLIIPYGMITWSNYIEVDCFSSPGHGSLASLPDHHAKYVTHT